MNNNTATINEDAFRGGFKAFYEGYAANPYEGAEAEPYFLWAREWQRGYNFAYFKQLRKTHAIQRSRAQKEGLRVTA